MGGGGGGLHTPDMVGVNVSIVKIEALQVDLVVSLANK